MVGTELRRKRLAMIEALIGTPEEWGPFLGDDEAASHFASGVVRRYETALALGPRKGLVEKYYPEQRPVLEDVPR